MSTTANPEPASEGKDTLTKVPTNTPPKRRILVVDDERDIADAVKMALSGRYQVTVYGNPSQALSFYRIGYYDLILLDYRMPFMDGFEFYSHIKRMDPKVKICLMTAYETFASKVGGVMEREARDRVFPTPEGPVVLKKPFDKQKLLSIVSQLLNE